MRDKLIIIGGGLAGLVNAILLARKGLNVSLLEKKSYPFHKVCGEYISNEVRPFLEREGLFPKHLEVSDISRFQFTSIAGRSHDMPLDLGGFGISRYELDHYLVQQARAAGVNVMEKTTVTDVAFEEEGFTVKLAGKEALQAEVVIGAYGKSQGMDRKLKRGHAEKKSPFIGVKYHIKTDFPDDKIALHNFKGGYCGISAVENERYNLCYLGSRAQLKKHGSIGAMEQATVRHNPYLKSIYENSDFLFEQPEVINEFSFKPKSLIEDHVLMSGDTAGLITPLCGNGMAMAIHSGKLLSDILIAHRGQWQVHRSQIEQEYTQVWNRTFKKRLWVGRQTQNLFGASVASEIAVGLMRFSPWIARMIMKGTHGEVY